MARAVMALGYRALMLQSCTLVLDYEIWQTCNGGSDDGLNHLWFIHHASSSRNFVAFLEISLETWSLRTRCIFYMVRVPVLLSSATMIM